MTTKVTSAVRSPHILIFEPEANGHQMGYIRYLLSSIERSFMNARITLLTTSEAAEHPNCQGLLNDFRHVVRLRIAIAVTDSNAMLRRLDAFYERQWRNAESLYRSLSDIGPGTVDFVLLPHLEFSRPATDQSPPGSIPREALGHHRDRHSISPPEKRYSESVPMARRSPAALLPAGAARSGACLFVCIHPAPCQSRSPSESRVLP